MSALPHSTFQEYRFEKSGGALKRYPSHMFRDTFAVELRLAGVPIDQASTTGAIGSHGLGSAGEKARS